MADPHSVGNYTRLSGLWAKISHEEDYCGLCPSLPFILVPLPSVHAWWPPPPFLFLRPSPLSIRVCATASSPIAKLLFPPPTLFSSCAPFSFIHSYFTAAQSSHRAWAPSHYNLPHSPSICVPLVFLPLGILLLSLPLAPCTPPLSVGAFLSLPFFSSLMVVSLLSLSSSPILPLWFLYISLTLACFFPFPPAKACNEVWQTLLP